MAMIQDKNRLGKVITFYSYKGGTGRSMALANIAVLLIQSRLAKKVLMIDWDLEAPGLHRYFEDMLIDTNDETQPGLIDLFTDISDKEEDIISVYISENLDKYISRTKISGLYLMPAGCFNDLYSEKINSFNWEIFFNDNPVFFTDFAQQLCEQYDFVLIDSRTGFTDTSGICTMTMPESLVLVFTPNRQSLSGVVDLGRKAAKYRLSSNDLRPLSVFPLASRIEMAEKTLRDMWRKGGELPFRKRIKIKGYQSSFEELFTDIYELPGCDLTDYFNKVQIQHEPKYAYGEEIAVLGETYHDERLSISKSYQTFLEYLTIDQPIYKIPGKINVFVSFHFEDREFAESLIAALEKKGIDVQSVDKFLTSESNWISAIENKIAQSEIFIPIVSPQYIKSKYTTEERYLFRRFRSDSKRSSIIPVVISLPSEGMPYDLENIPYLLGGKGFTEKLSDNILTTINNASDSLSV